MLSAISVSRRGRPISDHQATTFAIPTSVLAILRAITSQSLLVGFSALSLASQDAAPPRYRLVAPPGPYFVGQVIELVATGPPGSHPRLSAPRLAKTVEIFLRPDAGVIRLIPRQAGRLRIPAVSIRDGDQTARADPLELTIRSLPTAGRSAEFLGGVGPLTVSAELRPASVPLGKRLEFRLTLDGVGALGSTVRPRLAGPALSALAIASEPLPEELTVDPPRKVIRWNLRPARPGEAPLSSLAVATFDPKSQRYLTRASRSVILHVNDVPGFDSQDIRIAKTPEPTGQRSRELLSWCLGGGVVLGVGTWWASRLRTAARQPKAMARRFARGWVNRLDQEVLTGNTSEELAREVFQGFADYFHLAIGRPPGALTPAEAEAALERLAVEADLARLVGELLELCDQIRYGGASAAPVGVAKRARDVFQALAEGRGRSNTRRGGGTSGRVAFETVDDVPPNPSGERLRRRVD